MNVVCLGDSNTWGYDPRSYFGDQYPPQCRWVDILSQKSGWNVMNYGENGREIPTRPLSLPEGTDLLMIMLGTNDLLQGSSAEDAAKKMEQFLQMLSVKREKILLIAPPALKLGAWVDSLAQIAECAKLAELYGELSRKMGIRFVDTRNWDVILSYDGVHFSEKGQVTFAVRLWNELSK